MVKENTSLFIIFYNITNLIFYINKATGISRLYIFVNIIKNVFIIAYGYKNPYIGF